MILTEIAFGLIEIFKLDAFFVNQHVYVVCTIKSGPVKTFHVTRP